MTGPAAAPLDQLAQLRVPFPPEQIGKLPKRSKKDDGTWGPTVYLDYVGHADITARLLDVDPAWTWEPLALDPLGLPALDKANNLWIKLTVCGVTRIGVGDGKSAKEMIGDAIRNAAMRFGAALDLWAKGDRDYARQEQASDAVKPEWYVKTLDAIFYLPADKKESLRAWMEQEKIGHVPASWTEDEAKAIRHRIHVINPPAPQT